MLKRILPRSIMTLSCVLLSAVFFPALCEKADTAKSPAAALAPQTTCPDMGGKIDKKYYVDYNGKRIYACCKGCLADIKKDPEKYIKKLEAMGQSAETIEPAKAAKAKGDKKAKVAPDSVKMDMPMEPAKEEAPQGHEHHGM